MLNMKLQLANLAWRQKETKVTKKELVSSRSELVSSVSSLYAQLS